MFLVKEWKRVLILSISFWAQVFGLLVLIVPELLFAYTGIDTDPVLLWWSGVLLLLFGLFGRLYHQSGSPVVEWLRMVSVLFIILLLALFASVAHADDEDSALDVAVPLIAKWEGLREPTFFISFAGHTPFSVRVSGSLFVTPPVVDSINISGFRNAVLNGYMPPESPLFVFGDKSSVFTLNLSVSPSAIVWVVTPHIVNPINGQIIFVSTAYSPISERLKVEPFVADINMPITLVLAAQPAPLHPLPNIVQTRFGFPMCFIEGSNAFSLFASAASRFSVPEVRTNNHFFIATSTLAPP